MSFCLHAEEMGLNFVDLLTPTDVPSYKIVPRKAVVPLGPRAGYSLPVTFRTLANDRTELIKLELSNFDLHINVSSVCMLPFVELAWGAL